MFELLTAIGFTVLSNIVQILAGCIVAALLLCSVNGKLGSYSGSPANDLFIITAAALLGIVLPMGTYGVVPIVVMLIAAGIRHYAVLPLLISNFLFNMLVPFNDPGFIWRTGIRRVILALLAGILGGIILKSLRAGKEEVLRFDNFPDFGRSSSGINGIIHIFNESINRMGAYLLIGAVIDMAFHKYILWSMINIFNTNSSLSFIPVFFARYDVANPYFLLTLIIATMLTDFIKISALLSMLKIKGFIIFVCYYTAWAALLSISAFI